MHSWLVYTIALVIGCWVPAVEGLKISSTHTVGVLNAPISRATCGQTKVCVETPMDCDPSGNGPCLFISASYNGSDQKSFERSTLEFLSTFELRGDSESYVVLILSDDKNLGGNDETVVCAQYNKSTFFFTATFDNGKLTVNRTDAVSNVLASLNGNVIQCTFTRISSTSLHVFAGTGNFISGLLGIPRITLTSSRLDLTNSTSMHAGGPGLHPTSLVWFILLSALTFHMV